MDIEVDRRELHTVRRVDRDPGELAEGAARLRVDGFALTSNNISYGVFGDALRYWEFFPPSSDDSGIEWGRIPVWGFGEVVESRSTAAAVGERFYGYLPMSSNVDIVPGRSDDRGVTDMAEHRAPMAGAYNRYLRAAADPIYRPDREQHQMLLWPLFFTSFVVEDFLVDNERFGAEQIVISCASSKTAIGVAFLAHTRGGAGVVGLTSARNRSFVEGLGCYDSVLTYDDIDALATETSAYIDIAGDRAVLHAVHERLGEHLRYSMTVGGTHWDAPATDLGELPGPEPVFFFAPTQIAKRTHDWGRDELDARVGEAWARYADWADGWVAFVRADSADEVERVYRELLDGASDPRTGYICSLP